MQVSGSFVSDKPTSSTSKRGSAGFVRTFFEMLAHEGLVKGGFKGFSLNMIKGPIANGIAFSTKHFIERELLFTAPH
jgi:Mitochondrial carrier protein